MRYIEIKQVNDFLSSFHDLEAGIYECLLSGSSYVLTSLNTYSYIGLSTENIGIEEMTNNKDIDVVSESFALKMLAVSQGKVKELDL